MNITYDPNKFTNDLWGEFNFVYELFEIWREARPHLFPSQCPYGRELILWAIDLCEEAIATGDDPELAREMLTRLYSLLRPPPGFTPSAKVRLRPDFAFCYRRSTIVPSPPDGGFLNLIPNYYAH